MNNKPLVSKQSRNHLVAKTLFRKAGKHEKTNKAKRRQDKIQVKKESIVYIEKNECLFYIHYTKY